MGNCFWSIIRTGILPGGVSRRQIEKVWEGKVSLKETECSYTVWDFSVGLMSKWIYIYIYIFDMLIQFL